MPLPNGSLSLPGSGGFDVLEHYTSRDIASKKAFRDLSKIEIEALKVTATASHGWKASAAGPETIFSRAGLICTALRNSHSTSTIELLVFLKKNADDQPSEGEVVKEIQRRGRVAKAARESERAAATAFKAASYSSSRSPLSAGTAALSSSTSPVCSLSAGSESSSPSTFSPSAGSASLSSSSFSTSPDFGAGDGAEGDESGRENEFGRGFSGSR